METNIPNQNSNDPNRQPQIGKVKGGYLIIVESLKLLNNNKSTILFPLFSAIASSVAIAACVFIYIYFAASTNGAQLSPNKTTDEFIMYGSGFIFYLVTTFIVSFFQAGLAIAISTQINGGKITFSQAMAAAGKHAGKIFVWSLVWATVGVILDFIQNKTKLGGRIATMILGAAWGIATFFIVPVLVLENGSIGASLKRSVDIFKKKWGKR